MIIRRESKGFRYRVDGREELVYMAGDRMEFKASDEADIAEFFVDEQAARYAAECYVFCEGPWGSHPAACPFSITVQRNGIGSLSHRVAGIERYGFAVDADDPDDEGEWLPCDADGNFEGEAGGYVDTFVDSFDGLPKQVRDAFDKARRSLHGYLDYEDDAYDGVEWYLGWRGEGWYAFDEYGDDDLPMFVEKAQAGWADSIDDFVSFFGSCFMSSSRPARVDVSFCGSARFPDEDRPVIWEPGQEELAYIWPALREVVANSDAAETKAVLYDLDAYLDRAGADGAAVVAALEGALEDGFDGAEAALENLFAHAKQEA